MTFAQAIQSGFANYVNFSGRAIRSEYWYWVLFAMLGGLTTEIARLRDFRIAPVRYRRLTAFSIC